MNAYNLAAHKKINNHTVEASEFSPTALVMEDKLDETNLTLDTSDNGRSHKNEVIIDRTDTRSSKAICFCEFDAFELFEAAEAAAAMLFKVLPRAMAYCVVAWMLPV